MAKSLSGVTARPGKAVRIGDNRYGLRGAYDPVSDAKMKAQYRAGDTVKIIEIKNTDKPIVKTKKP